MTSYSFPFSTSQLVDDPDAPLSRSFHSSNSKTTSPPWKLGPPSAVTVSFALAVNVNVNSVARC